MNFRLQIHIDLMLSSHKIGPHTQKRTYKPTNILRKYVFATIRRFS